MLSKLETCKSVKMCTCFDFMCKNGEKTITVSLPFLCNINLNHIKKILMNRNLRVKFRMK